MNPIEALDRLATFDVDVDVTAPDLLSGMGGEGVREEAVPGREDQSMAGTQGTGLHGQAAPTSPAPPAPSGEMSSRKGDRWCVPPLRRTGRGGSARLL